MQGKKGQQPAQRHVTIRRCTMNGTECLLLQAPGGMLVPVAMEPDMCRNVTFFAREDDRQVPLQIRYPAGTSDADLQRFLRENREAIEPALRRAAFRMQTHAEALPQASMPADSYVSLTENEGRPCVLMRTKKHGELSAIIVPGRRRTIAVKPVADIVPLAIHVPAAWTPQHLLQVLNDRKEDVLIHLDRVLAVVPEEVLSGITFPEQITLGTRDEPILVSRTLDREGGELARELRAKQTLRAILATHGRKALLFASDKIIVLCGPDSAATDMAYLLRIYVRRLAESQLPWYVRLATNLPLSPITKITVTDASSRWGSLSCRRGSQEYTMHLNWRAILLERPLLDHLICHETSHTVAMNHQDSFYRMLSRLSPNWESLEKGLDKAWLSMPLWTKGKTPKR